MKEVYPKTLLLNRKYHRGSGFKKLRSAMDSLPGITTFCSSSDAKNGVNIWFKVNTSKQGLFFLTRCVDSRYWEYGDLWKIELNVGDLYGNSDRKRIFPPYQLPVHYRLHSGPVTGREAYRQAQSLIDNMNYHLNHENFIKCFGINVSRFGTLDIRREKLKKLIKKIRK